MTPRRTSRWRRAWTVARATPRRRDISTTAPASSPPATTAGPTSSSAAPSPTVSVQPAPSSPVHVATVHIGTTTYVISVWSQTTDVNCVAHAYGAPVIAY